MRARKVRFYEIKNYNAYNEVVTSNIFPAYSKSDAIEKYSVEHCRVDVKFIGFLEVGKVHRSMMNELEYHVSIPNNEYIIYSLDSAYSAENRWESAKMKIAFELLESLCANSPMENIDYY